MINLEIDLHQYADLYGGILIFILFTFLLRAINAICVYFPKFPIKTPLYCTGINIPEARRVFLRITIFLLHIRITPLRTLRLFVVTGSRRLQAESLPIPNHSEFPVYGVSFEFFVVLRISFRIFKSCL